MVDDTIDEYPKMSPLPIRETRESTLTFFSCLDRMADEGGCYQRLEWPDKGAYITIQNEYLMVYRTDDKKLHPLIVSTGDIRGMDWVKKGEKASLS
jgi:hypothetical protein